ncbi:MAG: hypothetical protein AB7O59_13940 [Pirellulales bacterium]
MNPFTHVDPWPNTLDALVTSAFLAVVLLVPAAGYVFMALDIRAYVRSLKRGLAVIGRYLPFYEVPGWARAETPRAIAALGLRMPCTEADLMRAYRKRVKRLHPDHGGDQRRFLMLQADFEEALSLVRAAANSGDAPWSPYGAA